MHCTLSKIIFSFNFPFSDWIDFSISESFTFSYYFYFDSRFHSLNDVIKSSFCLPTQFSWKNLFFWAYAHKSSPPSFPLLLLKIQWRRPTVKKQKGRKNAEKSQHTHGIRRDNKRFICWFSFIAIILIFSLLLLCFTSNKTENILSGMKDFLKLIKRAFSA